MPREVFATSTKLDDSVSSRTPAEYETLRVDGQSSRLASENVSASARIVIFDAFTNIGNCYLAGRRGIHA